MHSSHRFLCLAATVCIAPVVLAQAQTSTPRGPVLEKYDFLNEERLAPRFRTFYVTWGDTEKAEFSRYLEEARPDIVQAGWYGPMFFGYVGLKQSTGYPMQLPVSGAEACIARWREMHQKVRANGGKSVAHFTVSNVIRGPEKDDSSKPGYFADWYTQDWPEALLGAKPVPEWTDLVCKDAAGNVLIGKHYVQYNSLCVNNPATRQMLKTMVRIAIDNGADGFMTTYNYRTACCCQHCQQSFKTHLKSTYTPSEIRTHFHISDIETHAFEKIPGQTPGYPADTDLSPLTLASFQWSTLAFKGAWDEIFLGEGRTKKSDLILGQWDHLGNVGHGEERAFLPIEKFAKGENYLWYSGNHYNADVQPGDDNDGWLNGLYLRALAGDKPYVIGRYDSVRLRVGQAESMALGGAGTGLNNQVTDPAAYAVLKHYLSFAKAHENGVLDTHIRSAPGAPQVRVQPTMLADTCLVIPRQSLWAGKKQSMDTFRKVGTELVRRQYPLMMVSDEVLRCGPDSPVGNTAEVGDVTRRVDLRPEGGLGRFRVIILPETLALTDAQIAGLEHWMRLRSDHKLVIVGEAATLDNRGRPWAIAQPADGNRRMASATSFDSSRVERISLERLSGEEMDWNLMKPLPADPRANGSPRAAFDIWTEREGTREPLTKANSLRIALYRHPQGGHVLHLVNYSRDVLGAKQFKRSSPDAELPMASPPLWVRLPAGSAIKAHEAKVLTPDLRPDGSPEEIDPALQTDAQGNCWIRVGAVSVYRVLDMREASR
jgi:hypothetical protein